MIYLYTGTPGAGKTLFTLRDLYDFWEKDAKDLLQAAIKADPSKVSDHQDWYKYARPVYVNRVPELAVPYWRTLDDPKEWINCPDNSIILIDEAHEGFPVRPSSSKAPEYVERLADHRHRGMDLWFITQHPGDLDVFLRRRVNTHNHIARRFGSTRVHFFSWQQVCDNPDKARKSGFKRERGYPKEVYSWYKSAEAHTVKFKLPREAYVLIGIFFVIPLCVFAFYQVYLHISKPVDTLGVESKTLNSDSLLSNSNPKISSGPNQKPPPPFLTTQSYLEVNTPRIAGLPHTAPVFDALTTPSRVPVPAGCIASKTRCQCYTQDATVIVMDDAQCRHIATHGLYLAFSPDRVSGAGVEAGRAREDGAARQTPSLRPNASPESLPEPVTLTLPPVDGDSRHIMSRQING